MRKAPGIGKPLLVVAAFAMVLVQLPIVEGHPFRVYDLPYIVGGALKVYQTGDRSIEAAKSYAALPAGDFLAASPGMVARIDATGERVWTASLPEGRPGVISVGPRVFTVFLKPSPNAKGDLAVYDHAGMLLFAAPEPAAPDGWIETTLAATAQGFYSEVHRQTGSAPTYMTFRDPGGRVQWKVAFPAGQHVTAVQPIHDDFVAAFIWTSATLGLDVRIIDPEGNVVSVIPLAGQDAFLETKAVDSAGNLLAAWSTPEGTYVGRLVDETWLRVGHLDFPARITALAGTADGQVNAYGTTEITSFGTQRASFAHFHVEVDELRLHWVHLHESLNRTSALAGTMTPDGTYHVLTVQGPPESLLLPTPGEHRIVEFCEGTTALECL